MRTESTGFLPRSNELTRLSIWGSRRAEQKRPRRDGASLRSGCCWRQDSSSARSAPSADVNAKKSPTTERG